jgi:TolB-like protein/class 3 adenylate cyclase/Tfp pilus assembly protein PilF
MVSEAFKRKLAAILSADVEGYSRLMDDDEEATVRTLTAYRNAITNLTQQFRGRVVDSPGDNILAEFSSVVDAVNCAVEIQRDLAERNADLPYNRKMEFRIGVNLGDIIEEDGRIYGDGVNIAARVESLTEAGGICISGRAHDQVENKLGLEYEDLGKHDVKNISRPIQVYRVLSYPGAAAHRVVQAKKTLGRKWRKLAISAAAVVAVVAVIGIWQFYMRRPTIEPASEEKMAFPLPDKPSIAVLAFNNLSGVPAQEYFSDGITEDIITALSKTPKMFVIARNSTFTYKGKPVKVQQVAEELGVRYVLEGSVRKAGEKVRITAQLIDAKTGHHLWAEKYDRELKDIFALQDEITKSIITELQVKLTEGEQARLRAKGTDSLEVYLMVIEGRELVRAFNIEHNRKARQLLEEAIELDPNHAPAYRWLGSSHSVDVWLGASKSPRDSLKRAVELQKKALSIDSSLGDAHAVIGSIYILTKQYEKGMSDLEKAVELYPNGADLYGYLASGLLYTDELDEAILISKKAIRLNPMAPSWCLNNLAAMYRSKGIYEEALVWSEKAVKQEPEYTIGRINLSSIYSLLGRMEEARLQADEVMKLNPKFSLKRLEKTLPYKNPEVKKRYIEALRRAGLPE